MATINGLTAERMLEIEAASVVDGDVVGTDLFLTKHDGTIVNAGNVRGPAGPTGPMGHSLAVVSAQPVSDVGVITQLRAGRQLTLADFTNMGLSAPAALWNLGSLADISGNAKTLTNKGSVAFGVGINGAASSAAVFAGSTGQALYIPDAGTADPLRIKHGSFGCWFRTAKRGVNQWLMTKIGPAGTAAVLSYGIMIPATGNGFACNISDGAAAITTTGVSDCADDRWHFGVATFDGNRLKIYVDGVLENVGLIFGVLNQAAVPFNLGGFSADAANNAIAPFYGRMDEAFVTPEVLNETQIRNLYCASLPHALGETPNDIRLSVRRRRRGGPLLATDFPSQPLRLYNFTNGSLADAGSQGIPLTNPSSVLMLDGADGALNSAPFFNNVPGLMSTDAGLPSGLSPVSVGGWFKTTTTGGQNFLAYGTYTTGDVRVGTGSPASQLFGNSGADTFSGPHIATDGEWHHAVMVHDPSPADGLKRKLYIDGRLVASSTVLNPVVLAGANSFRVGAASTGAGPFFGGVDAVFVYGGVLTSEDVRKVYNAGSQSAAPSPKVSDDHIEAIEAARLLVCFDTLEGVDSIDLAVAA